MRSSELRDHRKSFMEGADEPFVNPPHPLLVRHRHLKHPRNPITKLAPPEKTSWERWLLVCNRVYPQEMERTCAIFEGTGWWIDSQWRKLHKVGGRARSERVEGTASDCLMSCDLIGSVEEKKQEYMSYIYLGYEREISTWAWPRGWSWWMFFLHIQCSYAAP